MKIISGLFETYQEADSAVKALHLDGYNGENISVVAQEEVIARDHNPSIAAESAGEGAGIGGIVGLIIGASIFAIPGVGPLLGTGSLVGGSLTGAGIGAAAGGTIGLLHKWFGDEDQVTKTTKALKSGHILVAVRTGNTRGDLVDQTMRDYGAYATHQHAVEPARALS